MKLLLIGWDAANIATIERLLERGLMPCFERLYSHASSGELQPARPWNSASLWTSIVTGKRATSHGIVDDVEVDPCRTRIQPTSRWTCTARPIWSVLSEAGYRTHALGWPASHPAEPINGISVSNQFVDCGESNSIHPPQHLESLRALRLSPREIDGASIAALVPRTAELSLPTDPSVCPVARFLASTASIHAAATWTLEREPWDFAAVRYAGLELLIRLFGPSLAGTQAGNRSADAEMCGDLISNAYRFFDLLFMRLLELAGPDTSVMLVSQQGWSPEPLSSKPSLFRSTPGILVASGPAFISHRRVTHANVCDVAPTILRLFGLPPEQGIHGCVLRDILSTTADASLSTANVGGLVEQSPHSAQKDSSPKGRSSDSTQLPTNNDDSAPSLNSLDDLNQQVTDLPFDIKHLEMEHRRRLAEAWSDFGDHDQAARILEDLIEIDPTSIPYRSALAEAHFRAGKYDACRRLIQSLQADGVCTPMVETGLAATDVREGRTASALEHLRRAETLIGASAEVLELIGRVYLRLKRSEDAARALDGSISINPTQASAHDTRALVDLIAGNPIGAERHAREAVRLSPQSYEARYHLGIALARQSRLDEAIDVLRFAVAIDRRGRGASAHRHLANLFERRGDHAMATHHRTLSHRKEGTIR